MRKVLALLLAAVLLFALCACGHEHIWTPATCTQPKTCSGCGVTEGEPLGHTWVEATCTEPKTCSVCGETEGEALGHTWVEATCTEPKTCSVCGETEGEPLGHTWVEATCTEPKICSVCGETEGEPLGHTWVEATCTEPKTCSVCGETEGEALGHTWVEATCTEPKTCSVCGKTEGEALGHSWVEASCTEPKTCSVCGETEGEALGHELSWEAAEVDNVAATRTLVSKCSVCGEEFETKEEDLETFVDGKTFSFTGEEFVARLQKAWDEQHPGLHLRFEYGVNSKGKINFDIYNQYDSWLGWGYFYDADGTAIDASAADEVPIGTVRIFAGPLDDVEIETVFYLFKQFMGPFAAASDPLITNGLDYEEAISKNSYSIVDGEALNGLHYTCFYDSEDAYFYLDVDIAS